MLFTSLLERVVGGAPVPQADSHRSRREACEQRRARDPQLSCELAFLGQTVPGTPSPGNDALADLVDRVLGDARRPLGPPSPAGRAIGAKRSDVHGLGAGAQPRFEPGRLTNIGASAYS